MPRGRQLCTRQLPKPSFLDLFRVFQQPLTLAIQLTPLARCEASNSEFRNFVEDRIDRRVSVIGFRPAIARSQPRLGNDMIFRTRSEPRFQYVPPRELRAGA